MPARYTSLASSLPSLPNPTHNVPQLLPTRGFHLQKFAIAMPQHSTITRHILLEFPRSNFSQRAIKPVWTGVRVETPLPAEEVLVFGVVVAVVLVVVPTQT